MMVLCDLSHGFLNILIRSLGFLRIDDMDIVIFGNLTGISLYFICVEYKDQRTFPVSLIITENIRKFSPCRLQIDLCKFSQLIPCKYDIVSVDKEIFFSFRLLSLVCRHI